jgi:hypothetical protein
MFEVVPLTHGLANLARQAKINYRHDPDIGYGEWDEKEGRIKHEPLVSIRLENLTAKEVFIALCENYDFILVKDPTTGVIKVKSDE